VSQKFKDARIANAG